MHKHHAPTPLPSSTMCPSELALMGRHARLLLHLPPHSLGSLPRSTRCQSARTPWPPWKLRPPQLFSPLPASSLPMSTTLSFVAISCTLCSCSPSQPAIVVVRTPAAAVAAGTRAWPSHRGPPRAKPSSPAGAQGPLGAPPPPDAPHPRLENHELSRLLYYNRVGASSSN
jgi:hypothetical protein